MMRSFNISISRFLRSSQIHRIQIWVKISTLKKHNKYHCNLKKNPSKQASSAGFGAKSLAPRLKLSSSNHKTKNKLSLINQFWVKRGTRKQKINRLNHFKSRLLLQRRHIQPLWQWRDQLSTETASTIRECSRWWRGLWLVSKWTSIKILMALTMINFSWINLNAISKIYNLQQFQVGTQLASFKSEKILWLNLANKHLKQQFSHLPNSQLMRFLVLKK